MLISNVTKMNKNINNSRSKKSNKINRPNCTVHFSAERITPSHRQFVAWPGASENKVRRSLAGRTKSGGYVAYPEG
jgi:hypothetical protein